MDIILQGIFIALMLWFIISRFVPVKGITNINPAEAKKQLKGNNTQGIDVRTPAEYQSHHSKLFQNIPLSNLSSKSKELDPEKEIIVICQSGMRSMKAAKMLKKQGFKHIYNVKGGMSAWR
ncbi:Rhodanese-related sulfurtransferase [Alteribacillus persepolensis]|uniref:Rhodanese-related sulfurtransferase n=1 Tax=Alteribacillus persepolensis TaxID=568899 RepID=A0A1G8FWW8_9BACI|nr:rhodanese-like domain-containing protein [Alteribacillus persepolensis]SDH86652.1 Rhodanese-related sulfurtransferase [Alteribacillus persepolensis]